MSAPHILVWGERTVMIDFPQAVDTRLNPNARQLLRRDVVNICEHFTLQSTIAQYATLYEKVAGA